MRDGLKALKAKKIVWTPCCQIHFVLSRVMLMRDTMAEHHSPINRMILHTLHA